MTKAYFPYLVLGLALLFYGIGAFHQLRLPGLHHDEAQEAGLMAMQLEVGAAPTLFREAGIVLANRSFPLMVQDYIGALNVYLAWIAFAIGGVSVESLRSMTVLTGAATLIFFFLAARRLAGAQVAALAVMMLALQPSFVLWNRQGVFVTSYILTLALAALWLLLRWWGGGRAWNLWLAAFLMGLGLWGKLLFIWFIGALLGAGLLLYFPNLRAWLRGRASLRPGRATPAVTLVLALLFGLLGLLPLLEYNRQTGGTLQNIFGNLDESYYGVDNANVLENFRVRLRQAPEVYESRPLDYYGASFHNRVARLWLLFTAAETLIAAALLRRHRQQRLFVLLMVLLMLGQSVFTSTQLWHTHFALILPFMVLMVAVGMMAAIEVLVYFGVQPYLAQRILIFVAVVVLSFDVLTLMQYHRALGESGGRGNHDAAIYPLADRLDSLPYLTPVAALDWGISPAVAMLTENRVVPNEVFGYSWEPDPGFAARLKPFFARADSVYVLHVPQESTFPRREAFFALAAAEGQSLRLVGTVNRRDGSPYFELWGAAD